MKLMELNARIANAHGLATIKIKITGQLDAEGCAEVSCVETVTSDDGQTIIFSDERGD